MSKFDRVQVLKESLSRLFSSPTRNWLDSRAGKALRLAVHVTLIAMIALVLVSLVKPLFPHHLGAMKPAHTEPPAPNTAPDIERIVATHMFGQPAVTTTAAPPSAMQSDTKVAGILYSNDGASSRAILTVNGSATVVGVGDTLPDGSKVIGIESNRVLLGQSNAPAALVLNFTSSNPGSAGPSAPASVMTGSAQQEIAATPAYTGDTIVAASAPALSALVVPSGGNPLDQLHALRSQLVRGHPKRYLDKSHLVFKQKSPPDSIR